MIDSEFRKAVEKAKRKDVSDQKFKSRLINPHRPGFSNGVLYQEKVYTFQLLRRLSEKAWLINAVIGHIIEKVIPYCRPVKDKGQRGFKIELKDIEAKMSDKQKKRSKEITEFFLNTGWDDSLQHEDDLNHYVKKILRDLLTIDQVAVEKLYNRAGELLSFEAVDAATILRCVEKGYNGDDSIRYVQMVDGQILTEYQGHEMLFQFDNPRTDINNFGYGYSKIEQCVQLVVASIYTFAYNSSAFTEDKLPRGMLLLNGDIGFDEVEEIEDYISDVMGPGGVSGANNRWGIPIIPSGKSGDKSSITWQPLGSTNKEMEYSEWQDFLTSGMCAIWGVDVESIGLKTKQASKLIESGSAEGKKYSDDKGIGNALTFLERHFQDILDMIDKDFRFVFHGFQREDAKDQREAIEKSLSTIKSLNEVRKENDLEPIKDEWADIPGLQNPQYLQAYQGAKQEKAEKEQQENQGAMGDEMGGEGFEEDQEEEGGGWDDDPGYEDDLGKSLGDDDTIEIII
jgi:hypothetical protein